MRLVMAVPRRSKTAQLVISHEVVVPLAECHRIGLRRLRRLRAFRIWRSARGHPLPPRNLGIPTAGTWRPHCPKASDPRATSVGSCSVSSSIRITTSTSPRYCPGTVGPPGNRRTDLAGQLTSIPNDQVQARGFHDEKTEVGADLSGDSGGLQHHMQAWLDVSASSGTS